MTETKAGNLILEEISFEGELSIDGETAQITFRVSADADCRLVFEVDSVPAATYLLAIQSQGRPGTIIQEAFA